jgi:hypothetical protein
MTTNDDFTPDKFERLKLQAQAAQFVFTLDPRTLLPLDLIAPVLNKAVLTVRTNVTRRPEALPKLTIIDGFVFVRVEDLLKHIDPDTKKAEQVPSKRRGRRTNAERNARAAAQSSGSQLAA